MTSESLWLGSLRGPVRLLALVSTALALATALWLIVGQFVSAEPIGMYEMLRPEGRPLVSVMLWTLAAAVFFGALYFSDVRGAIETEPTGPLDIVSLVLSRIAMIGVVATVFVMFYEVVARYAFEKPTLWANELSLWIAAFVFLLAGLYAMQQRSHIRIYIIYDMMPRWMQKASDCISVFLIWVFFLCLLWGGYNEAITKIMRMETFGTAWDPPLPSTVKAGLIIIIGLVALQALTNLIADWNKAPEHHSPADEIDQTEIENIRRTLED
ncbi:TRAP transporter small permease subunit [Salipiger marinus]|jgi:TRAP-type C4-dicarboxylate transport system permease small subunit|uniref:TRAP transporter small permease protein n=1 Tax=Salipiger marinus TaxID=555512 RepID=A0A1G8IMU1_9RHOB|nr:MULTISPECIES: TRAP transporter small permease [Salipiger]HBM59383.1 TRAP transporter small permease [Citreicella sp.]MCD1620867.1 TRAP transporter small permease [Salipiger manganoxidans]MEB3422026.1 TRAP transporter small permease [Salipiger manganoxidans]SDI20162.1 TRAP-type mannitol/chloroaromatic compound transport system, small permease component [Salipiger marinus]HBT03127.1 TRAP transporter small permease [Citreicella sp.]